MKMKSNAARVLLLVLAAAAVALAVLAWAADVRTAEQSSTLIPVHKTGLGALEAEEKASQTFTAAENNLAGVTVYVSNYNKKLHSGTLTLRLADEDGNTLASQTYDCTALKNNSAVDLELASPVSGSAGKTYVLWASAADTDQKGVTLRIGPPAEGETAHGLTLSDGAADPENMLYLTVRTVSTSHGWMGALSFVLIALCLLEGLPLVGGKEKRRA